MTDRILVVFTYRSVEALIREGGSQAWRLSADHARQCTYVVCTRNRTHPNASREEEHGAAFLVGRISSVTVSPERADRFIVRMSEYALLEEQPVVWSGQRSPVWYVDDFDRLGIDEATLKWHSVPLGGLEAAATYRSTQPDENLDGEVLIADLKSAVADAFNVPVNKVEVTIRL